MFCNSTNSSSTLSRPLVPIAMSEGWYMISLMTMGPTLGPELAVPMVFAEGDKAETTNGSGRYEELLRLIKVIGEEPSANTDGHGGRVVKLDGIDGRIREGADFVHDNTRTSWRRRISSTRRTADGGAGPPTRGGFGIRVGRGQDQREAKAVCGGVPTVLIGEILDGLLD